MVVSSSLIICIPLALSCFTHLWNPIGFPPIYIDEGHYLRRTLQVLNGLGPQEPQSVYEFPFDHPYFGQIFLAGLLSGIGYPDSLNPSVETAENSVKLLYEIPRLIMGILAIVDTFLVFKIGERWHGRSVGFISSTLFAVMPVTWFLRMIVLENIMLPFLLSSILLITYITRTKKNSTVRDAGAYEMNRRNLLVFLLSGVLFGLAAFTKESAVILIPSLGFLAYTRLNQAWYRRLKNVMIWLVPVIVISSIWPLYCIATNQFGDWLDGVLYQAEREERGISRPLLDFFEIDPLFAILSIIAIAFAIFRVIRLKDRDLFIFFWTVPYFLFLLLIGGAVKYFHFIILVPVLSIEIALFIIFVSKSIKWKKLRFIPFGILAVIASVGLISTLVMISSDLTSTFFDVSAYIIHILPQSNGNDSDIVTMVGKHWARSFYWIPKYVFGQGIVFKDVDPMLFTKYTTKSDKVMLVLDRSILNEIRDKENQQDYVNQLRILYDNSTRRQTFKENWTEIGSASIYPYVSIDSSSILGGLTDRVDVWTNY
jgi:4-amino-4-deoxy-L-arabinose transferase-like glycosyltransferase